MPRQLAGIKGVDRNDVVGNSLKRAGLWNEVQRRLRTPGGQQLRLCPPAPSPSARTCC